MLGAQLGVTPQVREIKFLGFLENLNKVYLDKDSSEWIGFDFTAEVNEP